MNYRRPLALAAIAAAAVLPLAACSTSDADADTTATASETTDLAASAERFIADNVGVEPGNFTAAGIAWAEPIADVTVKGSRVVVSVQSSNKELAKRAADSIANYFRLSPPADLESVQWVEVVDGTGTHLAQTRV